MTLPRMLIAQHVLTAMKKMNLPKPESVGLLLYFQECVIERINWLTIIFKHYYII